MDTRAKVYEILKSFSTTMLVTCGHGKRAGSRPMQIAKADEGGDVWFFTSTDGGVAEEISREPAVLLVFQNERTAYLSLRGRARMVEDRALMQRLWKEPFRVWFPEGPADPDLALLAVEPVSAEYWDNRGRNRLEYLFEAAKAYVTGTRPEVSEPEQHAKVNM